MATTSSKNWSRENLAWLAGLLEGDGCFTTGSNPGCLRVEAAMSDLDVLEKAQSIAGMGNISGPYNKSGVGSKPMYRWHVTDTKNAYALMAGVYTWLGSRRRSRITELFSMAYEAGPKGLRKTHCVNDHALTDDNVYTAPNGRRSCRICRREQK